MRFAANNTLLIRNCYHVFVWEMTDPFPEQSESDLIIGSYIMNMVIAKYHGLSASRRSIICLRLEIIIIISFLRLLIDIILLPTHKPWFFVQPRPVIMNYIIGTELYPRKSYWIKFALTLNVANQELERQNFTVKKYRSSNQQCKRR